MLARGRLHAHTREGKKVVYLALKSLWHKAGG